MKAKYEVLKVKDKILKNIEETKKNMEGLTICDENYQEYQKLNEFLLLGLGSLAMLNWYLDDESKEKEGGDDATIQS